MKRTPKVVVSRPRAVRPHTESVPRDVRLTANGKFVIACAIVFAAGALATGIILSVTRAGQVAEREAMASDAVSVSATVTGETMTKEENPRRVIAYRYSAAGSDYEGTVRLREKDRRELPPGSALPILYRGSQPARSWLPGREPGVMPVLLLPIIPAALLLLAAGLAWGVRRARVLLEEGRFAEARVLESTKVKHQHGHAYRMRYEFTTLSGAKVTATAELGRPAAAPGETMQIVYHRDNPRWNKIYPLSLVTPARR
jgi:hypothetical protein